MLSWIAICISLFQQGDDMKNLKMRQYVRLFLMLIFSVSSHSSLAASGQFYQYQEEIDLSSLQDQYEDLRKAYLENLSKQAIIHNILNPTALSNYNQKMITLGYAEPRNGQEYSREIDSKNSAMTIMRALSVYLIPSFAILDLGSRGSYSPIPYKIEKVMDTSNNKGLVVRGQTKIKFLKWGGRQFVIWASIVLAAEIFRTTFIMTDRDFRLQLKDAPPEKIRAIIDGLIQEQMRLDAEIADVGQRILHLGGKLPDSE